jgi:hypothetical protein
MEFSSMEDTCLVVCSYGIRKRCDVQEWTTFDWTTLKPGDLVYARTHTVVSFVATALPLITVPFVLVSGDSDASAPTDVFSSKDDTKQFCDDPRLIAWFSQNLADPAVHTKLHHLPIGLDYHTMAARRHWWGPTMKSRDQEAQLFQIAAAGGPLKNRATKVYCNFHFPWSMDPKRKFTYDRRDALQQMARECLVFEPAPVERATSWQNQVCCAFVSSPMGNGMDCHRTWEALALGCIPIVRTSALDPLFADLPVLIVKQWSDITPEFLVSVHKEYSSRTWNMRRTHLTTWINAMRSVAAESLEHTGLDK